MIKTLILTAILSLSMFSTGETAEWVSFGSTSERDFYYDKASIISPSKNEIRVWEKIVFNNEERKLDYIKNEMTSKRTLGKEIDYTNYGFTLLFNEINCVANEFRILSFVDYDTGNAVLSLTKVPNELLTWEPLIPGSSMEKLKNLVCKNKPKGPRK
jgi:hypothetical protein